MFLGTGGGATRWASRITLYGNSTILPRVGGGAADDICIADKWTQGAIGELVLKLNSILEHSAIMSPTFKLSTQVEDLRRYREYLLSPKAHKSHVARDAENDGSCR